MEGAAQWTEYGAPGRTHAQLALHEDCRGAVHDAQGMAKGLRGIGKDREGPQRDFGGVADDPRGVSDDPRGVDDGLPGMDDGAPGTESAPRASCEDAGGRARRPPGAAGVCQGRACG